MLFILILSVPFALAFSKRYSKAEVVQRFGGLISGGAEIQSNLDKLDSSVTALAALVDGWGVKSLDEGHTRELLALLTNLEGSFAQSNAQCSGLADRQAALVDACQLRALVHSQISLDTTPSGPSGNSNPFVWQRLHLALIELECARCRLVNMRTVGSASRPQKDPFFLGGGTASHIVGSRAASRSLSKGTNKMVDVDVAEVEVPKRGARALQSWSLFACHREMTLSPYWLNTFGFDDSDPAVCRFYYEYSPSTSIRDLLLRCSRKEGLSESSALFQHWVTQMVRFAEPRTLKGVLFLSL